MPEHDLILHNGKVITVVSDSRIAEAVAVKDGMISALGTSAEVLEGRGRTTQIVDLAGRTACPGFFDSHAHMDREGLKSRGGYSLAGCHSVAAVIAAVKKAVARTPKGEWVVFMPLGSPKLDYISRPDQLAEGRFPNRHDLDAVSPNHPVYIRVPWGWWVHRPFVSVANSAALGRAGITRRTEAPYNVEIVKDEGGEPTGVFLDRTYAPVMEFTLFRCVPRLTFEDQLAGCRLGSRAYSAVGTTSIYEGHGLAPPILEAYRRLREAGELGVRVHSPLSVPSASIDDRKMADLLHQWAGRLAGRGSGDDLYRTEGICVDVADAQAAEIIGLDYPYVAWAGHFYQSLSHERFVEIGVWAARLGIRLNCLVCYDLERVLRAYEAIDTEVPIGTRRWVMIHIVEATADQIRRMKKLGVIATVTPNFMYMAGDRFNLQEIGPRAMPIRELLDAGVPVALSSDNVPYSMLWTMWEALVRWDRDSQSRLGESRLRRDEALRLITRTGPLLTWEEDRKGTLEVGRLGDIVVLEDDPLTCSEDVLKDIPVIHTFLGGREVFGPGMDDPGPVDGEAVS
ncbi:MAG TPA: amidohydrolase [Rhodospirillales bacterium]|nr:amidohydrolase [Rhodospirillales bacterium]